MKLVWDSDGVPRHLPWTPCIVDLSAIECLRNSLECSNHFSRDQIQQLVSRQSYKVLAMGDSGGSRGNVDEQIREAWTRETPLHVDLSSRRLFYGKLDVVPPYAQYEKLDETVSTVGLQKAQGPWTVGIGDTVAVHWGRGKKRDPAKVSWAGKEKL